MPHIVTLDGLGYDFRVEIDGVEAGRFRGVDGMSAEIEVIERSSKMPGMHKFSNVTLKRGVMSSAPRRPGSLRLCSLSPSNAVGAKLLSDWSRTTPARGRSPRRQVTIRGYDRSRRLLGVWNVHGAAAATGWKLGGEPAVGVAIEELSIAHEGIELRP